MWVGVKTLFLKDGKEGQRARQAVKVLLLHKQQTETHFMHHKCFLSSTSFSSFSYLCLCVCMSPKNTAMVIQVVTPLLLPGALLMLHPPLDVFSR